MDKNKKRNGNETRNRNRMRLAVQALWTALTNGYAYGFVSGKIYTGRTKAFCVPGLNCYSCPGALGSCPIGALQGFFLFLLCIWDSDGVWVGVWPFYLRLAVPLWDGAGSFVPNSHGKENPGITGGQMAAVCEVHDTGCICTPSSGGGYQCGRDGKTLVLPVYLSQWNTSGRRAASFG